VAGRPAAVLDTITEDYVRTARAAGASPRRVLWRHVLRNSLIPIATLIGLSIPAIMSGALITESVFNYPGMGYMFFEAAQQQDYPTLLGFVIVVAVAMFPPAETELILVIALTSWLSTSRLIRGEALSLRAREYVQAMRVMGGGGARAVCRHIAPNAVGTIVVNATFQVADAILIVVALSYLGLGIRPPQTDWGGMLTSGLNSVYDGYWWQIFPPGIAIIVVVIAINFIGDGLRDAFEVRLQRS
jgi:ABC-type dipeptide/oligopeptide/nickel transport system permease subunit